MDTLCKWKNLDFSQDGIENGKLLVINTADKFKNYLADTESLCPEIDFEKNTLLIAYGVTSSGIHGLAAEKLLQTGKNEYSITVGIERNYTETSTEWATAVLAEKLADNAEIGLNIELSDTIYPAQIVSEVVAKGSLGGREKYVIPRKNIIITKNEEWEALKTEVKLSKSAYVFIDEDIDFSKYQLIAVFDEVRPSTGWTIDITNITAYKNEIVVKVENLRVGLLNALSQPFEIVKLPVSKKETVFDMNLLEFPPK